MERALTPYLGRSLALHGAVLAAAGFLYNRATAPKSSPVYTIDFVGPSAIVQRTGEAAAPAASAPTEAATPKPQPQTDFDEFGRRKKRKRGMALPRPSLLRGWKEKKTAAPPAPSLGAGKASSAGEASASAPGEGGIVTDMPNFPYPWYISQLRAALWAQWLARMPKESGQCVVVFSLLPNGSIVDLRTEESSGDSSFDLTALSAVQDAAPYPPLPRGFSEPFLKIHVTLKAQ